MKLPLKSAVVPVGDHPGTFGYRRKYDIHTGIDLYTVEGAEVYAMENGEVVKVDYFTGPKVGLDFWNETMAVMVEGKHGVINYGEIQPCCLVGQTVKAGDVIGHVIPVLPPEKLRTDIPGHSCSMLHIELYEKGWRSYALWGLNDPQPKWLKDPKGLL